MNYTEQVRMIQFIFVKMQLGKLRAIFSERGR